MIVVMTKFPLNPEYVEAFKERVLEKFGEKGLTDQPGFVKMNILEPKNIPGMPMPGNNTFIIETVWETMEDFINYTRSEAFREAHKDNPPKEMFQGRLSVEVYEIIKEK